MVDVRLDRSGASEARSGLAPEEVPASGWSISLARGAGVVNASSWKRFAPGRRSAQQWVALRTGAPWSGVDCASVAVDAAGSLAGDWRVGLGSATESEDAGFPSGQAAALGLNPGRKGLMMVSAAFVLRRSYHQSPSQSRLEHAGRTA